MLDRAFTGFASLPPPSSDPKHWSEVLGVSRAADLATINAAYREKAKQAHSDVGGSDSAMAAINDAVAKARSEKSK
jgi:DnaJ-class molecular chaperone